MRKINFLLAAFMIFSFYSYSCNSGKTTDMKKMLSGKWELKTMNSKEVVKEKTGGAMPNLVFNLSDNSLSGNTGCNDLDGKINATETEISFSNMSMTKIFCSDAEYEKDIVSFLFHSEPANYKIEKDLLTLSKSDKTVMILKKVE